MRRFFFLALSATSCLGFSQVLAFDSAADSTYNDGLQANDNGGFGFTPWSVSSHGDASYFVGSSTGNGTGQGPGIDTGGRSWGSVSASAIAFSSQNSTQIGRRFSDGYRLRPGDRLSLDLDFGPVTPATVPTEFGFPGVAINLLGDSSGPSDIPCQVGMGPSSQNLQLVDYRGSAQFDFPLSSRGHHLEWHILSPSSYKITLTDLGSGQSQSLLRTSLTHTNYYGITFRTSFVGANPESAMYLNSLRLSSVPEPGTVCSIGGGLLFVILRRRRSSKEGSV